jgi:hypothetical protein
MICIHSGLYGIMVHLEVLQGTRHEHVGRDVVRASHENRDPIQLEVEGGPQAIQVWLLDPIDGPDTISHSELIHDIIVESGAIDVYLCDNHFESVEGLLP